jgi:hypothetical protein
MLPGRKPVASRTFSVFRSVAEDGWPSASVTNRAVHRLMDGEQRGGRRAALRLRSGGEVVAKLLCGPVLKGTYGHDKDAGREPRQEILHTRNGGAVGRERREEGRMADSDVTPPEPLPQSEPVPVTLPLVSTWRHWIEPVIAVIPIAPWYSSLSSSTSCPRLSLPPVAAADTHNNDRLRADCRSDWNPPCREPRPADQVFRSG